MATLRTFLATQVGWLPIWGQAALLFIAILAGGFALQGAVMRFLNGRAKTWHPFLQNVFRRTRRVTQYVIVLFAVAIALPLVPLSKSADDAAHRVFLALFIIQLGWVGIVAANIAMDRHVFGLRLDTSDNLLARKAVTQMTILRRAINIMLGTLTAAFALMSFDSVRQFGISLFASAGLAGIVAGLAARPLFENLIAGVQLAFTQPLRLEDAVVINNEWGWVEEITSTYIVIRLWDLRRQIVPLSYLFQNPFTNWTRSSSSIIGTVFLYADYTLPVSAVRAKAEEVARASPLWDGQVVNVQVSDAKAHTMELRILISASDSSKAWDLRCEVREKLIAYIGEVYPECLPRLRWSSDIGDEGQLGATAH